MTERGLQLGHMFDVNEALQVGLIDEIVDESQVYSSAEREMTKWLMIPSTISFENLANFPRAFDVLSLETC